MDSRSRFLDLAPLAVLIPLVALVVAIIAEQGVGM